MNFYELKIGEARQIWQMLNKGQSETRSDPFHLVGKKVLVRFNQLGVQVGIVSYHETGGKLVFAENRKLWRWAPASGIALESLCINGPDPKRTLATAILEYIVANDQDAVGIFKLSDHVYSQIMALTTSEQS